MQIMTSQSYKQRLFAVHDDVISRVTGPLWGESTGHRWIPLSNASDMGLWYFFWSAPEQTIEQTIEILVIWDAIRAH